MTTPPTFCAPATPTGQTRATAILSAVLLAAGLLLSASTVQADEAQRADDPADPPSWTRLMPPKTALVVRLQSEPFERWMDNYAALLMQVGEDDANFPAEDRLSALAVAMMAGDFDDLFTAHESPTRWAPLSLKHLDGSRPALFAISTYGHRQFLQAAGDATLPPKLSLPQGTAARQLLPSKAPAKLQAEIEAQCERERVTCEKLVRLKATDDYLVADLMIGDTEAKDAGKLGWKQPATMFDADYFDRMTPAARRFVDGPGALGLYARTDAAFDLTTIVGQAVDFYEHRRQIVHAREKLAEGPDAEAVRTSQEDAVKWLRLNRSVETDKLYLAEAVAEAYSLYAMRSPATREVEDTTLVTSAVGERGIRLDAVQSFTEHGQTVAAAGRMEASLPTSTLSRAILRAEWAYDLRAALDATRPPAWLRHVFEDGSRGLHNIEDLYGNAGEFGFLTLLGQPMAMAKAAVSYIDRLPLPEAVTSLADLKAGRLALDFRSTFERRSPVKPMGSLSLLGTEDALPTAMLSRVKRIAQSEFDAPLNWTTRRAGLLDLQADETPPAERASEPVSLPLDAEFDLDRLMARGEIPGGRWGFVDDEFTEPFYHLERIQLQATAGNHGRAARLRLGPGDIRTPELPDSDVAPRNPSGPPSCARDAHIAVLSYLRQGALGDFRSRPSAFGVIKETGDGSVLDAREARSRLLEQAKLLREQRTKRVREEYEEMVTSLKEAAEACAEAPSPWPDRITRTLEHWKKRKPTADRLPMLRVYDRY